MMRVSVEADRFNTGKPEISYITEARYALEGCAEVLMFGAEKYSRSNWKKGLGSDSIIDSMLRHLMAYQSGEAIDPESGCHHLDHITCNALFLAHHHNGKKVEGQEEVVLSPEMDINIWEDWFIDR